jgi:hypothetical protein
MILSLKIFVWDAQVRQLKEQNEVLRATVANAQATLTAAIASKDADFEREMSNVKGQAVRKIKQLMDQVRRPASDVNLA